MSDPPRKQFQALPGLKLGAEIYSSPSGARPVLRPLLQLHKSTDVLCVQAPPQMSAVPPDYSGQPAARREKREKEPLIGELVLVHEGWTSLAILTLRADTGSQSQVNFVGNKPWSEIRAMGSTM